MPVSVEKLPMKVCNKTVPKIIINIPNYKFFRSLCTFHLSYTMASEMGNYFKHNDGDILKKNINFGCKVKPPKRELPGAVKGNCYYLEEYYKKQYQKSKKGK